MTTHYKRNKNYIIMYEDDKIKRIVKRRFAQMQRWT